MRRSALNPKRTTTLYKLKHHRDSNFEKDFGLLAPSRHDESAAAEAAKNKRDPGEDVASTVTRKKSAKSMSCTGGGANEQNDASAKTPLLLCEEESPGLLHDQEEKVLKGSRFFPSPAEQEQQVKA